MLAYDLNHQTQSDQPTGGLESYFKQLLRLARRSRELRRRLVDELALILRRLQRDQPELMAGLKLPAAGQPPEADQDKDRQVFEFIQGAELRQLAMVELELGRSSGGSDLLALVSEPNLGDRLLFPQLTSILRPVPPGGVSEDLLDLLIQNNNNSLRQEAAYCLYVRQLYQSLEESPASNKSLLASDPLGLVRKLVAGGQVVAAADPAASSWRQDPRQLTPAAAKWRRIASLAGFKHLSAAHSLQQLLGQGLDELRLRPRTGGGGLGGQETNMEEGEEELDAASRQQGKTILMGAARSLRRLRRSEPVSEPAAKTADHLFGALHSFELVLGLLGRPIVRRRSQTHSPAAQLALPLDSPPSFPNVSIKGELSVR